MKENGMSLTVLCMEAEVVLTSHVCSKKHWFLCSKGIFCWF